MNYPIIPYRIFPLGDSAITVDYGNTISESVNREILNRFYYLRLHPLAGMTEAIPAYSSLTVYYDLFAVKKITSNGQAAFDRMKQELEVFLQQPIPQNQVEERLIEIPVCYDHGFAPDLHHLAKTKHISVNEAIQIHTSGTYRVYMLGFLPGFTYMGEVDDKIACPRKPQPANVASGSVGIAGKQTGLYPMASPGGWQIIGRTPVKIFDKEKEDPVLLKAGDRVRFNSISRHEFENY